MTAIRLLGDRVLVALPPKETMADPTTGYTSHQTGVSPGGIVLVTPTEQYDVEIATRGIVMQLGEKRGQVDRDAVFSILDEELAAPLWVRDEDLATWEGIHTEAIKRRINALASAPFDVAVGDCVIFAPSSGEQFELHGINYVILREAEILGVVAPLSEAAA